MFAEQRVGAFWEVLAGRRGKLDALRRREPKGGNGARRQRESAVRMPAWYVAQSPGSGAQSRADRHRLRTVQLRAQLENSSRSFSVSSVGYEPHAPGTGSPCARARRRAQRLPAPGENEGRSACANEDTLRCGLEWPSEPGET